jgi:VWFA-related protein
VKGVCEPDSLRTALVLCLLLWISPRSSGGQSNIPTAVRKDAAPASQPQNDNPRTLSGVYEEQGLLKLDVAVTDASGKPVSGLRRDDFTLLDNGQPSNLLSFQPITGDSVKSNSHTEIVLVLDTLNVPGRVADRELREVTNFLTQNGGHLTLPISIYSLSHDNLRMLARPSLDGNALASAISHPNKLSSSGDGLGSPRGEYLGTSYAEDSPGILALKALAEIAATENRKTGRKLLLWISPGRKQETDLFSKMDKEMVFSSIHWYSTLMRQARITLYSISMGEPLSDPHALQFKDYLTGVRSFDQASINNLDKKVLAIQSGGLVLTSREGTTTGPSKTQPTGDLADSSLVSQMNRCVEEAAAFYTVSFNPAFTDHFDDYHDLRVQISKPGLVARTHTGYYDQPYFFDLPHTPPKRVTVDQLQQALAAIRYKRDAEAAKELSQLELTERLSSEKLLALKNSVRGSRAAGALVALADTSAFLAPPPGEILADPPPGAGALKQMSAVVLNYVHETMPRLPNFFAVRSTARYEEGIDHADETGHQTGYQPVHWIATSRDTMLFRNGHEVAESAGKKSSPMLVKEATLATVGTFGPILGAITDAITAPGGLTWSRWEKGSEGHRAVLAFSVSQPDSRYRVGYCCLPDGGGTTALQILSGYHGEITIDPDNGAILRLVIEADLRPDLPIHSSNIAVEYGPVEIGSKLYICPVKSVSLSRSRTLLNMTDGAQSFRFFGPFATLLNDASFFGYHIFRSDSTVLAGFDPEPNQK